MKTRTVMLRTASTVHAVRPPKAKGIARNFDRHTRCGRFYYGEPTHQLEGRNSIGAITCGSCLRIMRGAAMKKWKRALQ